MHGLNPVGFGVYRRATSHSDLAKRCLVTDSARAALTSIAAEHALFVEISEVRFMMTHLAPDSPRPVPINVVYSTHPLTVAKSSLSATSGSSAHTLSIPPSTDRIFVGVNLTTAGATYGVENGHDQFEPSLSSLQVQCAGQTLPNTVYQSLNKSATDRHVIKPYSDFLAITGKMYLEQSAYDNMEEWQNNPITGLAFEKPPQRQFYERDRSVYPCS